MRLKWARRVFRVGSVVVIALVSTAAALMILYSMDNLGGVREAGLAGLLMLILLPGLTLGAIVMDRRMRGRGG